MSSSLSPSVVLDVWSPHLQHQQHLRMQVLSPLLLPPPLAKLEMLEVGPSDLCFHKSSRGYWRGISLGNGCSPHKQRLRKSLPRSFLSDSPLPVTPAWKLWGYGGMALLSHAPFCVCCVSIWIVICYFIQVTHLSSPWTTLSRCDSVENCPDPQLPLVSTLLSFLESCDYLVRGPWHLLVCLVYTSLSFPGNQELFVPWYLRELMARADAPWVFMKWGMKRKPTK